MYKLRSNVSKDLALLNSLEIKQTQLACSAIQCPRNAEYFISVDGCVDPCHAVFMYKIIYAFISDLSSDMNWFLLLHFPIYIYRVIRLNLQVLM